MSPTQVASISCPACRNPLSVPVENIIDAQSQPELKARFLQGQLNVFRCPSCGNVGMLALPLVYHDGAKQLLFCLTPANMNMKVQDTQKTIGALTNALMNSLPPEQRKAYLFQPRTFLTMESMVEAILEADGITKEMIEAQRAKLALIDRLLAAKDDDKQLKAIVAENQALFDVEFFEMIGALIEAAQTDTQKSLGQDLLRVRQKLLPLTKVGRDLSQAEQQLRDEIRLEKEELMRRLIATEDPEELADLVNAGRPYLDYAFFQELTDKIEAASPEESKKLSERREQILTISEQQDEEAKKVLTARMELLRNLLQSDDPQAMLREQADSLDQAFFSIVSANARQAAQVGHQRVVKALQELAAMAMEIVQEKAPPAVKLINQVMESEYPDETLQVLKEHRSDLTDDFDEVLEAITDEMEARGQAEAADRLRQIAAQVEIVKA